MTREKHKFVICTMLLILFLWGTSIVSIAQEVKKNTVTINVKNESVEKVLKRINKETSLNFFYDPAILSKASSVTLNVKDMPLQEVLNMLSVQTGLNFQRINNTISVNWETNSKQPIQSPKEKITGTIKDNNGDPVIGASIQIKNTGIGTITDYNGQFLLNNVPENGILIISYIGYDTEEIPVNKKKNLQIVMKENTKQLEEIVVVAYGTAKKSSFTGSAEVVKQDRIEKRVVADVSKALEGTVAGVQSTSGSGQPGSGASMVIRGFGSISASNTPLYVVDGVPFDGALNTINPNDNCSKRCICWSIIWFERCKWCCNDYN